MTLTKAIKALRLLSWGNKLPLAERIEAAKLGIEALKAYRQARQEGKLSPDELLPGETKE